MRTALPSIEENTGSRSFGDLQLYHMGIGAAVARSTLADASSAANTAVELSRLRIKSDTEAG